MGIFITQLIYIKEGEEAAFQQFEDMAIPLISKYNGKLLFRLRPGDGVIEMNMEQPYEVHLIEFGSTEDFQRFMADEERKKFLHLKERSVRESVLIRGTKM